MADERSQPARAALFQRSHAALLRHSRGSLFPTQLPDDGGISAVSQDARPFVPTAAPVSVVASGLAFRSGAAFYELNLMAHSDYQQGVVRKWADIRSRGCPDGLLAALLSQTQLDQWQHHVMDWARTDAGGEKPAICYKSLAQGGML
jgi:hypothetical protein